MLYLNLLNSEEWNLFYENPETGKIVPTNNYMFLRLLIDWWCFEFFFVVIKMLCSNSEVGNYFRPRATFGF